MQNEGPEFIRHNNSKIMMSFNKRVEESNKKTSDQLKGFLNETLSI